MPLEHKAYNFHRVKEHVKLYFESVDGCRDQREKWFREIFSSTDNLVQMSVLYNIKRFYLSCMD